MALNEGQVGEANGHAERDPRIERLYREAARNEPPARLDAAILAAARRELGAGPRPLVSKLRRWHVPISIAAVVVVSVSLVVLVREEQGERIDEVPVPAAAMPAEQRAAPPAPPIPPEVAKETMQRQLAVTPSPRRESRNDREAAAKSELAADSRPEPGPPAIAGAGAVATPAGKPLPQPFLAAPSPTDEERAVRSEAEVATAGRTAGAPSAPGEPQAARLRADARGAAPLAGAAETKAVEQDRPPVWQGLEREPPEKWLARIKEMKVQGRGADAQELLSEFKRRFPDYPLPPGLK